LSSLKKGTAAVAKYLNIFLNNHNLVYVIMSIKFLKYKVSNDIFILLMIEKILCSKIIMAAHIVQFGFHGDFV
jgi:hypothetical protein